MIGIKLAASRRADDPLLDPICRVAAARGVPVLHHVWQHRRRDYPGQEASDARELGALAARHPRVALPAGPHRRRRRLAALAPGDPSARQRVRGPVGQRRGRRHAGGVHRRRGRGAPALGLRPHHRDRLGQAPLSRAPAAAGGPGAGPLAAMPPASSRQARSPPTDAHRRQRLRRLVSLPPRARHVARGGARGHGSGRPGRGLGHAPARRVLARSDRGQRLAARGHPRGAAPPPRAGGASRPRSLARRASRGGGCRRACRPRRSHVLRARSRRRRDARARRGLWRGRHAARARRAVRGRAPAAPQRPRAPSFPPPPSGRSSGATRGSACS